MAVAAAAGGALNSFAGGGSFLTLPTLLLTGVGPIEANATSTVALWPGSAAAAVGYRRELPGEGAAWLWLGMPSLVGGVLGALLLVKTPPAVFLAVLPVLLLTATLVFTFGEAIQRRLPGRTHAMGRLPTALAQLLVASYGGYFGGGMGLMLLAVLSLAGLSDIHRMNGVKSVLAVLINGVAVVTFVVAGKVAWDQAAVMIAAAMAGGFGGASWARRLDPRYMRRLVVAIGWVLTAYFFARALK